MNHKKLICLAIFVMTFGLSSCSDDQTHEVPLLRNLSLIKKSFLYLKLTPDKNKYYFYKNVSYLGDNRKEKTDIYVPYKKLQGVSTFPAVMYIHGGGWCAGDKAMKISRTCAEALVEKGYVVFCPNYSLNKMEKLVWPQNIYDCKSALRYIRKVAELYDIDPQRIGVMGDSAGGHLALLLGLSAGSEQLNSGGLYTEYSSKVTCIVDLYGVPDVRVWGDGAFVYHVNEETKKILDLASPVTHLSDNSPPILILHGTNDFVVDINLSKDFVKLLEEKRVKYEFVPIYGGYHAFTLYPDSPNGKTDLRPMVIEFLDKYLNVTRNPEQSGINTINK
jgi:acetyl esterase/lipase